MTPTPRTTRARRLRRDATDAEKRLWRALREVAPGWRFRRQHPVGPYIVDIAVVSEKLAIELDGGQHAASTTKDAVRTAYLEERGWRALRFWNNDVLANTEGVVGEVINALESPADLGG